MTDIKLLPIFFLFIAACIGVLLRFYLAYPFNGFNYPNWLHAHSHTMFLGWVFNALLVSFLITFTPQTIVRHRWTIIAINILLVAMLLFFPLYGYNVVTIVLSTLHTVVVAIFIARFFRDLRTTQKTPATWFTKASLVFYLVAAVGPFVLGAIVANGLGKSMYYYLSVYYYLHFQYNGVFTFGVLALILHLVTQLGASFHIRRLIAGGWLLFVSCFPTYLLSALWTHGGIVLNIVGFAAAAAQVVAFWLIVSSARDIRVAYRMLSVPGKLLVGVGFASFALKLLLQLLSAFPFAVELTIESRPLVIAYLHLVLIGLVTSLLLAWYHEMRWIDLARFPVYLLLTGFVISEITMLVLEGQSGFMWLLISSLMMAVSFGVIASKGINTMRPTRHR